VVSRDGRHIAYIAVVHSGDNLPAFLVVDKARLQIQYKGRHLGPEWIPAFAPDSSKIVFIAERSSGKSAVGFASLRTTNEALAVQWGPEFDAIDRPTWAPDSGTYAYAAARSRSEWVVMRGADVLASFRGISYVEFSPVGTLAFRASDGRKQFIVLGSEHQPAYDRTTAPTFRRDGTLIYTASDARKHLAIVGSSRIELPHSAEGVTASADGKRITYWYREERGSNRFRLVVNDVRSPDFVRVSRPSIHEETGAFAYTAQGERGFVVATRGSSSHYDGVLWDPQINADGTLTAYAALKGNELWWKIESLR
jgi:hypothetical protein